MISLDEKLQSDIRGRIIGFQAQMNTFDFFFGLIWDSTCFLTQIIYRKPYSKQGSMSAISGKRVAHLTKAVLQKMRSDASFKSFYDAVILKSKNYSSMTGPVLPRRTRAPRIEIGTGEPAYPPTTQDYYRQIYFEYIDLIVNAIEQRFEQPSFAAYVKMDVPFS